MYHNSTIDQNLIKKSRLYITEQTKINLGRQNDHSNTTDIPKC